MKKYWRKKRYYTAMTVHGKIVLLPNELKRKKQRRKKTLEILEIRSSTINTFWKKNKKKEKNIKVKIHRGYNWRIKKGQDIHTKYIRYKYLILNTIKTIDLLKRCAWIEC